ncbi:MAG: PQQ-binding-like beta-propeller repeat protein [Phycisphaerae bacterium]
MRLTTFGCLVAALASVSVAAGPVGWRGDGGGVFPDAAGPTKWTGASVLWKTKLPAWGNSSPVVVGDKVFVTCQPHSLVCVDAKTGNVLWSKPNSYEDVAGKEAYDKDEAEFKKAYADRENKIDELKGKIDAVQKRISPKGDDGELNTELRKLKEDLAKAQAVKVEFKWAYPQRHAECGFTTPTPASDGKRVYALFGTGIAACYDLDGNRKWIKFVERPTHAYGQGSSPVLVGGKVILHIAGLTALDAGTGEVIWKTPSARAWGTPARAKIGDVDVVITASGDCARVSDGKILASGLGNLGSASPIVSGGAVYFVQEGGKAWKLPAEIKDDKATFELLWTLGAEPKSYYASPVLVDGLIYACNATNMLTCIDAKDGKEVYRKTLDLGGGNVFPSLAAAGKLVYIMHSSGTAVIVEAGREFSQAARCAAEPLRSSPVFDGRRMYIRGLENLWCVGE